MKQLRHVLALTLVFCMVFGMVTPSLAVSGEISVEEDYGIPVEEDGGIEIEVDDRSDYDIDEDREELSVLPKQDETADETNTTGKVDGYNYNIIHLDCGGKYFSVDSIKKIIDNASAAGFNYIQLAVGNDGMRFLLDDMSLTVNGTTYTSDAVKAKIHEGNENYNNFDVDELTQSEMDTIIAYAYTNGMGVIPLINTPGHMDAILSAATSLTGVNCAYYSTTYKKTSVRTIDVTNSTAVAFTKAFLKKYITYFAGKGCKLFNMGADEYANDTGSPRFSELQNGTGYEKYVEYLNAVSADITSAGMTPMAFNDGIYYNNVDSTEIDNSIIIEYWSGGWSDYNVAQPTYLVNKGFNLVNTHGDWYWIVGGKQIDTTKASQFNYQNFSSKYDYYVNKPDGSTFCIWSDVPKALTDEQVATNTAPVISAFGGTLPTVDSVTNGGTTDPTPTPGTGDVVPVELTVGGRKEFSQTGDAQKTTNEDTTVATVTLTPVYGTEMKETPLTSLNSTTSFYIKNSEGKYLNESAQWVDDYLDAIKWVYFNTSYIGNYLENSNPNFYLRYNNGWTTTTHIYNRTRIYFNEGCLYRTSSTDWVKGDNGWEQVTTYSNPLGTPVTFTTTTSTTPESTTVTITGKAPTANLANGYTKAVVGGVTYNITVNAIEETKSLTVSSGKTAALNVPALDESIVGNTTTTYEVTEYITVDETDGTITAGKVTEDKTATVVAKVKNAGGIVLATYTYNVTITKENLDEVTPITVEYWITNSRIPDANNNTSLTITAQQASGEEGLVLSTLVPETASKDGRTQEYWQSKILDVQAKNNSTSGTELQTTKSGDDETLNGSAFTKIRYYNSKWQVYTTEWTNVERTQVTVNYYNDGAQTYRGDKNQLVAYYVEIIDINNANGNSELHVNAADWGIKGNGGDWGYSPESNRCSVSVQIVYEDGSTNPADTTATNLKSKTIVYGYWDGGRGLGTMIFDGQGKDYQIYKVTAETGTMKSSASGNYVTVTNFTWAKNELPVWEGELTDRVTISNSAKNPSFADAEGDLTNLANIAWDTSYHNKNNAILIRVYVKAIPKEDTLNVYYVDQNKNNEVFYKYSIPVDVDTTFSPNFAKKDGTKFDLINNTVQNSNGKTQTVTGDLAKLSEIGAYYRYSNFDLVLVERKNDNKEVWLYYKFNNNHSFVVDFGVPLHLTPSNIIDSEAADQNWDIAQFASGKSVEQLDYGTATIANGAGLTYTPTKVMEGYETISINLRDNNDTNSETNTATHFIYLYPATNVLYEENVITNPAGSGWTTTGPSTITATTTQATEKLGEENLHGYDNVYKENTGFSGGTAYKAELTLPAGQRNVRTNDVLSFTFTGTGFDLISECGTDTGVLLVNVYRVDSQGNKTLEHGFLVDTYFSGDATFITGKGILDYQVPVVRDFIPDTKIVKNETTGEYETVNVDPYGTYEVTVKGFLFSNSGAAVNSTNAISTYSTQNVVEETLASLGIPEEDFDLYEVVYMDDNSILNGGTGAETSVVKSSDVATFVADIAMDNALELNDATDGSKTAYVYVDGIRVYHTMKETTNEKTEGNTTTTEYLPGYVPSEYGITYSSVYDIVAKNGTVDGSKFYAYVETDGNHTTIEDYKNKGPENEIYLTSGNSLIFKLSGYKPTQHDLKSIQISAKAVTETAQLTNIGSTAVTLKTNTEMYYTLTVSKNNDTSEYYLSVGCGGDSNDPDVISISAIKLPSGVTFERVSKSVIEDAISKLNAVQNDEFVPAIFTINADDSVKSGKKFYLSAQSSTDVDMFVVTYNDVDYEIKPSNKGLVEAGVTDVYWYSTSFRAPKNYVGNTLTLTVKAHKAGTVNVYSKPIELEVVVK